MLLLLILSLLLIPASGWANHERPYTREELLESGRMYREMMPPEQQQLMKELEDLQRLKHHAPSAPPPPPPTPEEFERMKDQIDEAYLASPDCPPHAEETARIEQEQAKRNWKPYTTEEVRQQLQARNDAWQKGSIDCAPPELKEQRRQMREERHKPHPAKDPSQLQEMRERYRKFKEEQQKATPQ